MKAIALVFSSLALLAAACSASPGASQAPTEAPTQAPSQAPSATPAASETAGGMTITVMQSDLGAYLAGPDGHALYVLTNDSTNTSTCTGSCAQTWPPLLLGTGQAAQPGDGVTGTIATFARADGATQVSVGGMPLYYFAADSAPGQTNGQGVAGVWFLAAPDGSPLGAGSSSPAAATTPAGGSSAATSPPASIHIRY